MEPFTPTHTNSTRGGNADQAGPNASPFRSPSSPTEIPPPPQAGIEPTLVSSGNGKKAHKPALKALLSCEMCRHRKIKCDKGQPCGNCRRAGVSCVSLNRRRLPRGRNGGRKKADVELKARVGRLENLVRTLETTNGAQVDPALRDAAMKGVGCTVFLFAVRIYSPSAQGPCENNRAQTDNHDSTDTADMSRYLGSTFWANLSHEVR